MVQDIVEAARKAGAVLKTIRDMPPESIREETLLPLLRQAVCSKLMIEELEEDNLRNLVVASIKKQDLKAGHLPDEVIQKQIRKYDCHQTSLAAQKKVLLLMYIEKELGIHMSDEDAVSIETLNDLARLAAAYLRKDG